MEAVNEQSRSIQNEEFWKNQYELQKASGISRTDYCRQHNLNYDRFGYWISRWNRFRKDSGLVSVKLKSTIEYTKHAILCTLELKNGYTLKVHDTDALLIILEKLS